MGLTRVERLLRALTLLTKRYYTPAMEKYIYKSTSEAAIFFLDLQIHNYLQLQLIFFMSEVFNNHFSLH